MTHGWSLPQSPWHSFHTTKTIPSQNLGTNGCRMGLSLRNTFMKKTICKRSTIIQHFRVNLFLPKRVFLSPASRCTSSYIRGLKLQADEEALVRITVVRKFLRGQDTFNKQVVLATYWRHCRYYKKYILTNVPIVAKYWFWCVMRSSTWVTDCPLTGHLSSWIYFTDVTQHNINSFQWALSSVQCAKKVLYRRVHRGAKVTVVL